MTRSGPDSLGIAPRGEREVAILRSFAAPRSLVYDAYTSPDLLRRWLGPRTWELRECDIDLRVGGAWRYVMHGPDGAVMVMSGVYREVVPPERLVSTEVFDDDWTGGETLNTTEFMEHAGVTTVTTIVRYASREAREGALASRMAEGLGEGFGRLDDVLATGAITVRYRRRADVFEARVAAVPPDRWGSPSPCAEWTARDVVGHVVDMHAAMLDPVGRSLSPAPDVGTDPLAAFRAARADVDAVLADPDVAGRPCDTPMGTVSFAEHVDGVVSEDLVVHGWDLSRATGQDDTIDAGELERMWPAVQAMPEVMRTPGAFGPGIVVFGPLVEVPDDAPLQHRVLAAMGRDPTWRAGPPRRAPVHLGAERPTR